MLQIATTPNAPYQSQDFTALLSPHYEDGPLRNILVTPPQDAPWDTKLESRTRTHGLFLTGVSLLELGEAAETVEERLHDAILYNCSESSGFAPEVSSEILEAVDGADRDDATKKDLKTMLNVGIMACAFADGIRYHMETSQMVREDTIPVKGTTRTSYTVKSRVDPRSHALLFPGASTTDAPDLLKEITLSTTTAGIKRPDWQDFQDTAVIAEYESSNALTMHANIISHRTAAARVVTLVSGAQEIIQTAENSYSCLSVTLPAPEDGLRSMARLLLLQKQLQ